MSPYIAQRRRAWGLTTLFLLSSTWSASCLSSHDSRSDGILSPDPSYVVTVHSSLAEFEASHPGIAKESRTGVVMSTKTGTQYYCYLPSEEVLKRPKSTAESAAVYEESREQRLQKQQYLLQAAEALAPKASTLNSCHILNAGYWTFEVCPSQHVRMFHISDNSEDPQYSLGLYDRMQDSFAALLPSHQQRIQQAEGYDDVTEIPEIAYTQVFRLGSDGRRSDVQYVCSQGAHRILNVDPENKEVESTANAFHFLLITPSICPVEQRLARKTPASSNVLLVKKLLEPLYLSDSCLRKTEGWWTYEVCLGRYIRQYHKEADGTSSGEYVLGEFDDEANEKLEASEEAITSELWIMNGQEISHRVFIEKYSAGSVCPETGAPRTATLVFFCSSGHHNYIVGVKEDRTCGYQVQIATPLICAHPLFRGGKSGVNVNEALTVHCVPYDEDASKEEQERDNSRRHHGMSTNSGSPIVLLSSRVGERQGEPSSSSPSSPTDTPQKKIIS